MGVPRLSDKALKLIFPPLLLITALLFSYGLDGTPKAIARFIAIAVMPYMVGRAVRAFYNLFR